MPYNKNMVFQRIAENGSTEDFIEFATFMLYKLPDAEKVRVIFHEIGHILFGHFSYKDKNIVRVPDRDTESLTRYIKEYEAEKVCETADEGSLFHILNAVDTLMSYWGIVTK